MIPAGTLSSDEWREVAQEAALAQRGLLGIALRAELNARLTAARTALEDANRPVAELRALQGAVKAYKRDTMILDDILRQARAGGRVAENSGDTDA